MKSRIEKNKIIVDNIRKEKEKNGLKIVSKIFFIILLAFFLLYAYCRIIGTSFIKTNEYVIKNNNIGNSFHGVKILHLSDLLYGSTIHSSTLKNLLKEIKLINPDIVFYTGDLIDNNYKINKNDINYLKDFLNNIPYKIGKYAVKGELDSSTFDLIIKDTDFYVLNDTSINLYNNSSDYIILNGLTGNGNLTDNNDPNYRITLIHNFDYYNKYQIKSNLVLSGHNLNGEIYLFKGLLGNNKYNGKYYEINNEKIYISNGLGSIHKLRLFNHPSMNVYRLYTNE